MAQTLATPNRPADRPWSFEETWEVAWRTTTALHKMGLDCCLFGSMGAKLHGNNRDPNDIDIIILNAPPEDVEAIKQKLEVAEPERFHRKPSRNPKATYQILWYRIDVNHSCKVDLLVPGGDLRIPIIPLNRVEWQRSLPVAPFSVVFLLKLQGWSDHISSAVEEKRHKQYTDHGDVEHMLRLAVASRNRPLEDPIHLKGQFDSRAKARVEAYTAIYPNSALKWQLIGFPPTPRELIGVPSSLSEALESSRGVRKPRSGGRRSRRGDLQGGKRRGAGT